VFYIELYALKDMTMLIGQNIAILGAGIAGLAAARALALRGARVTVYERAAEIAEVGAGLQLTPNGVRVLKALGLDLEGAAQRATGVELRDGLTGKPVLALDFAKYKPDSDFLMFHRADLIALLERGARDAGVQIALSHTARRVTEELGGATLYFEDDTQAHHDLIIGADGLRSVLRPALNASSKAAPEPFFTGQTAWRATVSADAAPAVFAQGTAAQVHMAPKQHIVCYPLRGGSLINIVAVQERQSWTEEGWHQTGDPDVLRRDFAGFNADITALLAEVREVAHWGLFRHDIAQVWHGHCTALIGDAAHPTLPFLAQGANLALEDAWALAECLADMPLEQALPAYQMRRHARVARVIAAANANARNYHLSGPLRVAAHAALRLGGKLAPRAAVDKFAWLYDHDVTRRPDAAGSP
jgi:salicylate hydroxylase